MGNSQGVHHHLTKLQKGDHDGHKYLHMGNDIKQGESSV